MAAHSNLKHGGRKGKHKGKFGKRHTPDLLYKRKQKWQMDQEEIEVLKSKYNSFDSSNVETFDDFPISQRTKAGLLKANFISPTDIQKATIGLGLQDFDILGAAKTGSGKTLAFLVPVLECLYRNRFSAADGLGALVISPTRELAYQTFEVLTKVGVQHDFSAGLVIGGKDLQSEAERICQTNIVVCTPGRLLQHMDETANFECSNLKILVLDEADRILDLGFEKTMNAIIENIPNDRQTLLFSATQTKSVRDLARLSLKDPKFISVHHHHEFSTPVQLEQSYVVCDLDQKVDLLYSFIRSHTQSKILVFMASCKQVKYIFDIFCMLQPGITVMALYGTLHQMRRMAVYNEFCKREHAVLFATDIAARGLDFPAVSWVMQLDCPEDADTYIHRAGRTARYEKNGESLLVLTPSEEKEMLRQLVEKKIPVQKIKTNPKKQLSIRSQLQSFCAEDYSLKQEAQRCFISYVKSVYLMKNKQVFNVKALPLEDFSFSLGLAVQPRVRFLKRAEKRQKEQQMMRNIDSTQPPMSSDPNVLRIRKLLLDGGDSSDVRCPENSVEKDDDDGVLHESDDEYGDTIHRFNTKVAREKGDNEPASDVEDEADLSSGQNEGEIEEEDVETSFTKNTNSTRTNENERISFEAKTLQSTRSDDDDDNEDLFTVKQKDVFGAGTTDKDEVNFQKYEQSKKKSKHLTKAAMVKKIRKKKIVVNTKVIFDDEGEVVEQWPKIQVAKQGQDEDTDGEDQGGINIERAKSFLHEEDKHDKELFKQRVREKHKARRLKEKEEKKRSKRRKEGKESGDDDDFDGGVMLAVQPDDHFDVDLLPDPDKSRLSDEDEEKIPKKRKTKQKPESGQKRKKSKKTLVPSSRDTDTGLTLAEDEELALHILSSKS
ncbi:probable ATP-dependent RNA helicase DDX10 [Anneissia japonica]|uniref:probable ATP-dependent RNA helicase DDX10 n=1 Tax=Anneissia japonica TaxID=1529436 RepID=UPI001425A03A|nr:probable ATP-dependent RNA helicase DDX10 [Anneissia japonica]